MKSMAGERFTLSIGSPAALMVRKQTSRAAMMRQDVGLGHKQAGRGDQHQEGRNEDGEIDALHGWKGLSEKGQLVSMRPGAFALGSPPGPDGILDPFQGETPSVLTAELLTRLLMQMLTIGKFSIHMLLTCGGVRCLEGGPSTIKIWSSASP